MRELARRYVFLERLGEGGMGVVHRALDRWTGQPVAIKQVLLSRAVWTAHATLSRTMTATVAMDEAIPAAQERNEPALLALAQEFRALASLRHPHIISVLDYGFEEGRNPFLVLQLLEEHVPLLEGLREQPIVTRVRVLLEILQALTYVHRHGLLHRDLKPENIALVRSLHVKLYDFGLACLREQADATNLAGTIPYMAPELFLGLSPSEASDLWSVGIIAHEVLLGTHPLEGHDAQGIISALLARETIVKENHSIDPALHAVLAQALHPQPAQRFSDARTFARALAQAARLPLPPETSQIRESYLQAATFVARDSELATLREALERVEESGRGELWLVGGESGVGKSRLIEELRVLALVHGTQVLRGQAIAEGGTPHEVWRGILRPLSIGATLDVLDWSALLPLLPELPSLREETVAAVRLDPEHALALLTTLTQRLLFDRKTPLLVLLEDLQWAAPASLSLLANLLAKIETAPVLLLGTFRNDEQKQLPEQFPGAHVLSLEKLSRDGIARISTSMLGLSGAREAVLSLLEQETEGNIFFIVEVLRALAAQLGTLEDIGTEPIPASIAAGGVRAVLARKLAKLPSSSRTFVQAAAVLGRELELPVLREQQKHLGSIEEHLPIALDAAVIEVHEDRWRFAHDKLRETLLQELTPKERRLWHLRSAEAIERAYHSDLSTHTAALAYHFDEAQAAERALHYRISAGEKALTGAAPREAVLHLQRAEQLLSPHTSLALRAKLQGLLARALFAVGRSSASMKHMQQLHSLAASDNPALANTTLPPIGYLLSVILAHQWKLRAPKPIASEAQAQAIRTLFTTLFDISEAAIWTSPPQLVAHLILTLRFLSDRSNENLFSFATHGAIAYALAGLAPSIAKSSRAAAQKLLDPEQAGEQTYITRIDNTIAIHRADWSAAEHLTNECLQHTQRFRDWRLELAILFERACFEGYRGAYQQCFECNQRMLQQAQTMQNSQFQALHTCVRAVFAPRARTTRPTLEELRTARALLGNDNDGTPTLLCLALLAREELSQGLLSEAKQHAEEGLRMALERFSLVHSTLEGLPLLFELQLHFLQNAAPQEQLERAHNTRRMLIGVAAFSRSVPIARPRFLHCAGLFAAHYRLEALARSLFTQAAKQANEYQMPYEKLLAETAIERLTTQQPWRLTTNHATDDRTH